MNLQKLQQHQINYDADFYEINEPAFDKIRHILLHLTKTNGKLASYCEAKEHKVNQETPLDFQFSPEIISDLLVYELQLSNVFQIDLEESYLKHLENNANHIKQMQYAKYRPDD